MKADKKIIDQLNQLLSGELTAVDLYFLQSRIFQNRGLSKLYERLNHDMSDEIQHAEALIERILFLEGMPNIVDRDKIRFGNGVREMLSYDLKLEMNVAAALKEGISSCEACRDYQTRAILNQLLKDTEEDHIKWLETQLDLLEKLGEENYLQSQI